MEIWEPKPPGTLWATPGLLRDCFYRTPWSSAAPYDTHTWRFGTAPIYATDKEILITQQAILTAIHYYSSLWTLPQAIQIFILVTATVIWICL